MLGLGTSNLTVPYTATTKFTGYALDDLDLEILVSKLPICAAFERLRQPATAQRVAADVQGCTTRSLERAVQRAGAAVKKPFERLLGDPADGEIMTGAVASSKSDSADISERMTDEGSSPRAS